MDKVKYYEAQLDKELSKTPLIRKLEQVTTVPKVYLFLGFSAIITILVFFDIGGAFITTFVGWLVPAFYSLRALETKTKDDDVQWLTYWSVYGFLSVFEFFTPVILYLIPFYYFFKLVIILYLMLPYYRGAEKLHASTLRPLFLKLTSTVDDLVNDKTTINEVVGEMKASAEAAAVQLEKTAAQAASTATEKANVAYQNVKENVSAAATKASETANSAVETVKENVGQAVGVVKENAALAAETVKENVGQAVETAKENATLVAETASHQANAAYEATKDGVNSAVGTAQQGLNSAVETTKQGVDSAVGTAQQGVNAATEKAGEVKEEVKVQAAEAVDEANKVVDETIAEAENTTSEYPRVQMKTPGWYGTNIFNNKVYVFKHRLLTNSLPTRIMLKKSRSEFNQTIEQYEVIAEDLE
ncbi:hypothetical protein K502DRAFT_362975 [Neoconidiobolus thromboides FSU 785]|nr:hypothetical protein K502DRAFT_362975 [Neoconidiobolus thromboides FSU 785]